MALVLVLVLNGIRPRMSYPRQESVANKKKPEALEPRAIVVIAITSDTYFDSGRTNTRNRFAEYSPALAEKVQSRCAPELFPTPISARSAAGQLLIANRVSPVA